MATRILRNEKFTRKTPLQQRSRSTVAALVEAGARVLVQHGWSRFTTNQVAEIAGVSIGSLYQYFPDKLALAEAIRQRHLDEVLKVLTPASMHGDGVPNDTWIAPWVDGIIATHSKNQTLHRILLDEVPLSTRSATDTFEMEYQRRYQALVRASARARQRSCHGMAGHVLASAVEGIVHTAARRGELELPPLRVELNNLVRAYLQTL
ncbi:TetR/AcrR family transcriptional regulator [Dyella caseinilytica]|uniref:TetR/AcrR family transcriptional regulator n=1 Tax=Dyella caseinilytica TaxID=1849581 RepID=A0ABX7H2P9_9GAMM|nr:TetR/AcrR family transcriptional regulator [Dyella caseinilytica]QRN55670.1 TetR/AcrR family transcriptional regulator [Dyella caseinilytica]GGA03569.1 TetR family transcriptional regulator [Dyella caseinilytica]